MKKSKGQPIKQIEFLLKGDKWTLDIISHSKFAKLLEERNPETLAYTEFHKRRIVATDKHILEESTIMHELVHAYVGHLCLDAATMLKPEVLEEIYCELFTYNYKAMISNLKEIKRKLK